MTAEPEVSTVDTADGVTLTLTRLRGGDRGPVLLVHGAGVRAQMFALPTIADNFADYLRRRSYDVWLLDWRASIAMPPREFTLDDAARFDMPAAVTAVRERCGVDTIQAVVHCAGSNAFFMSMAEGRLPSVRTLVASQVALHFVTPPASRIKARLHLPAMLRRLGVQYMTPAADDGQRPLQLAIGGAAAVHLECDDVFCHRLSFIYGHLYHHAQLNAATHDRLEEQFGRCSIAALQHLSQMVNRGSAQKFDYGRDGNLERYGTATPPGYLDPQHFRIPITFLSGARNRTYLPQSTRRTFDWLVAANGSSGYHRHVVDGYGHLDTFMGARAVRDTYPLMLDALDRD
jgi:choline dehydrogenase-like flavoprotein